MNVQFRSRYAVSMLALLATGCLRDPAAPEIIIDHPYPVVYAAVSANDRPLPLFITADGTTSPKHQLTSAWLLLIAPDTLRLELFTQTVASNGDLGAFVSDILHARLNRGDSIVTLTPMGTYPMRLQERATIRSDGDIVLTVDQPLPSSGATGAAHPIELRFQRRVPD